MRSLLGLVFLVLHCNAFRAPRADPGAECWYGYTCASDGTNIIEEIRDLETAVDCYDECAANEACEHFTFRELFSITVCQLMESCDTRQDCSNKDSCVSGPKDCSDVRPCDMLEYTQGNALWTCDGGVEAYKEPIPAGSTCHTSCGGWKSKDGKETVKASAKCVNGLWEDVILQPDSDANVNPPNMLSECTCEAFPIWYNPNVEPGADFYCSKTSFTDASIENPKEISADEECVLMCDNYLVANIRCQNGFWTDADPAVGIACYSPPPTTGDGTTVEASTNAPTDPPTTTSGDQQF